MMDKPSGAKGSTVLSEILEKLRYIEKELVQVIRGQLHPKQLSAYEAHAFVRQAIKALSRERSREPMSGLPSR